MAFLFIGGTNLDIDAILLVDEHFKEYIIDRRGEYFNKLKRRKSPINSLFYTIGDLTGIDFSGDVDLTTNFLKEKKVLLEKVKDMPGLEYFNLRFIAELDPDRFSQFVFFTKDLLKLCGQLGIDIELTYFTKFENDSD